MTTTAGDSIWTPDSGDAYALSVDLAAMADTIQVGLDRRLRANEYAPMAFRGTAAQRSSTTSSYWQHWVDTTPPYGVYVGDWGGGWRPFSGIHTAPAGSWSFVSSDSTIVGRTITVALPIRIEPGETLQISSTGTGSGFGLLSLTGLASNATNTTITLRHMQLGSTTLNAASFVWTIVPAR